MTITRSSLTADGWNPVKQWRNPANGRFIDMPNVALDKLADLFNADYDSGKPIGSLADAPESVVDAINRVVEQRGGMTDPSDPLYARSVDRALAAIPDAYEAVREAQKENPDIALYFIKFNSRIS